MRFIPSWFPGAGFKRYARSISKELALFENVPFDWAKKQIVRTVVRVTYPKLTIHCLLAVWGLCWIVHVEAPRRGKWSVHRPFETRVCQMGMRGLVYRRWRYGNLIYLCDSLGLTVTPDCLGSHDLLSCYDTVSRSAEKSADRYRPACVKSLAHMRRLRLVTLRQGNNQGGPSLGSCCSPGFATFRVERWCLRKSFYPKRNNNTWQHLVHISKFCLP